MKQALLFGASGFIGAFLLTDLLDNADYEQVTIVVRKALNMQHPKLKMLIGDFDRLPSLKAELVADDVFIALGTTKNNTPDERLYYQVDHDYPVLAAKLAKENGAQSVFVVSAVGPNAHSNIFYIRTKGETERDIQALDYTHTYFFRPSMLMGARKEKRTLEKFLIGVFRVINPLFMGSLKKFRGIEGKQVARAMNQAARHPTDKVKVLEWQEMMNEVKAS